MLDFLHILFIHYVLTKDYIMRTKRILQILNNRFNPHKVEIIDFTNEHHGHAGQDGSSETHIRLRIGATEFEDTTLLRSSSEGFRIA